MIKREAVFVFFVLLCGCNDDYLRAGACEDSVSLVGWGYYPCHRNAEGSLQTVEGRTYFVCKCRREGIKP